MGWIDIDHETGVFQHREYIGGEWVWNRPLKGAERGPWPDMQTYTIRGNSNYTQEYVFTKIKLVITEGSGGNPLSFNYIKLGHAESTGICSTTLSQQIDGTSYEITWDLEEDFQTTWLQSCAFSPLEPPYLSENYSKSIYIEFQTAIHYNPLEIVSIQGWVEGEGGPSRLYKNSGYEWKITEVKKKLPPPPPPPEIPDPPPEPPPDNFFPPPKKEEPVPEPGTWFYPPKAEVSMQKTVYCQSGYGLYIQGMLKGCVPFGIQV